MARLPELAAVLVALGPGELPSPLLTRDLGEGLDLLAGGGRTAVEFEKQRRLLGKREMRVGDAGLDLHLVGELDAGEREPHLHGDDGGLAGAFEGGEGAARGENGLGDTVKLQRELGDDAKRALGADQEMGEIVAACRFPGALPGVEQRAVGQHRREAQDVVAHSAVAHGVGARGAGRRHAAEARIGAGVDGEEETLVAQMIVQCFARHTGLDHAVEVLFVHGEDTVHARQVERHAAERCIDVAFERSAGAERDHRHAGLGAKLYRLDHLLRGLGEQHRIGRLPRDPGQRVGVLLAQRRAGREAIAEPCRESREQNALGLSRGPLDSVCHECTHGGTLPPSRFTKSEALERRARAQERTMSITAAK